MKKLLKKATAILATTVMVASIGMPAFAATDAETDAETAQQVMPRSSSFTIYGGSGEWGAGMFNAWCSYMHMDKSHRAVLQTDNSYHYSGWEDGGTKAYVEASVGSDNHGTGEVR